MNKDNELENIEPDFLNYSEEYDEPNNQYLLPGLIDYKIALHDYTKTHSAPEKILSVDGKIWGTRGNFSVIIGKAKSKKTYLLSAIIPTLLGSEKVLGLFESEKGKNLTVLHFDTEQAPHHIQKLINCALKLGNISAESIESRFKVFGLRKYSVAERNIIIESALKYEESKDVVIIDGIRDLMLDINNMTEANEVVSKLLKWSSEYSIHIIVVIHENKTNHQIRGNIGTELMNKCETSVRVIKDNTDSSISKVEFPDCRDICPEPFAFRINSEGILEFTELITSKQEDPQKKYPFTLENNDLIPKLRTCFSEKEELNQTEFRTSLRERFTISDKIARDLIKHCINQELISENRKNGKLIEYSLVC